MNSHGAVQPFMALVDDDSHSARLMIRMLLAHGAPSVSWLDGEAIASTELGKLLDDRKATLPGLVIVDLKSSSNATADFVRKLRGMQDGTALLIAFPNVLPVSDAGGCPKRPPARVSKIPPLPTPCGSPEAGRRIGHPKYADPMTGRPPRFPPAAADPATEQEPDAVSLRQTGLPKPAPQVPGFIPGSAAWFIRSR